MFRLVRKYVHYRGRCLYVPNDNFVIFDAERFEPSCVLNPAYFFQYWCKFRYGGIEITPLHDETSGELLQLLCGFFDFL